MYKPPYLPEHVYSMILNLNTLFRKLCNCFCFQRNRPNVGLVWTPLRSSPPYSTTSSPMRSRLALFSHRPRRGAFITDCLVFFFLHRRRSSVNFRGARHFCPKNMYEKFKNARILHDSCPKNYQNTLNFMIFARKNNKIP